MALIATFQGDIGDWPSLQQHLDGFHQAHFLALEQGNQPLDPLILRSLCWLILPRNTLHFP